MHWRLSRGSARPGDVAVATARAGREVSDRLTLRSLGPWGRRNEVATVMISHERLDRLVGQVLPKPMARALACGTPAVVSRTSALPEILTTDCGATAANDPRAIAHAVTSVISRPERLRRINARQRAEQFTWPRAAAGMLDALGAG